MSRPLWYNFTQDDRTLRMFRVSYRQDACRRQDTLYHTRQTGHNVIRPVHNVPNDTTQTGHNTTRDQTGHNIKSKGFLLKPSRKSYNFYPYENIVKKSKG